MAEKSCQWASINYLSKLKCGQYLHFVITIIGLIPPLIKCISILPVKPSSASSHHWGMRSVLWCPPARLHGNSYLVNTSSSDSITIGLMPCIQIFIIQHQNIPLRKNARIKTVLNFFGWLKCCHFNFGFILLRNLTTIRISSQMTVPRSTHSEPRMHCCWDSFSHCTYWSWIKAKMILKVHVYYFIFHHMIL